MKKTILFLTISLMSLTSFSQVISDSERIEREKLAGQELKIFANHHYAGTGFGIGGGIMVAIGYGMILQGYSEKAYNQQSYNWDNRSAQRKINTGVLLTTYGGIFSLVGVVYKIEAPMHVKKAGLILSGNGVSLKIKLN